MAEIARQLILDLGRQTERRFIQHQQARQAHQGHADRHHLPLAPAQGSRKLRLALLEFREKGEDLLQRCRSLSPGARGIGAEKQVFADGHAREERIPLRRLHEPTIDDLPRRHPGQASPFETDVSGDRPDKPETVRSKVVLP